MAANKTTPLKALQKKKMRLQVHSDALVDALETNFQYLQDNFGSLIGQATVDATVSKLPPFVQNLLGVGHKKEKQLGVGSAHNTGLTKYTDYADMALELVPYFTKGPRGLILTFLLRKAKDLIFGKR